MGLEKTEGKGPDRERFSETKGPNWLEKKTACFLGYLISCPLFVSGKVWGSILPGIDGGFSEVIIAHISLL